MKKTKVNVQYQPPAHTETAVLIPVYNEAKTIKKVVTDFKKELPTAKIYVYDNNSSDQSAEIAAAAGAIVRREPQQGKGNVVRRAFREIEADVYLMVDGDDTYMAADAPQLIQAVIEGRAEMAVGDRLQGRYFTENKRRFHNSGNKVVRACVNKLFKTEITDIMTGYRAMSRNFVKTFPVLSQGFEIETEMSIHAARHHIGVANIPVDYQDRPEDSPSKLNTIPDGLKVLRTILTLTSTYRPLGFYGLISLILVAVALVLLVPVFVTYFNTGLVPQFPSLIVGCFLILTALLLLMVGLILWNLLKKDARDFEFKLVLTEELGRKR